MELMVSPKDKYRDSTDMQLMPLFLIFQSRTKDASNKTEWKGHEANTCKKADVLPGTLQSA